MRKKWVLAAMAVSLAMGGCAGTSGEGVATLGDDQDRGGNASSDPVDPEEAQLAFAECMRENGVEVPDPAPPGDGEGGGRILVRPGQEIDEDTFEEADAKCRHHLEGVFDEPSDEELQEMQDRALAFARCMRENGVEKHPDPSFEGGRTTMAISEDDVLADPDFEAAEKECRKHLPGASLERAGS